MSSREQFVLIQSPFYWHRLRDDRNSLETNAASFHKIPWSGQRLFRLRVGAGPAKVCCAIDTDVDNASARRCDWLSAAAKWRDVSNYRNADGQPELLYFCRRL